jgi:hypothetical protein
MLIISNGQLVLPKGHKVSLSKPILKPVVVCTSQRFKEEVKEFISAVNKLVNIWIMEPDFRRHKKKMIRKREENRLKAWSYRVRVPGMALGHVSRIHKVNDRGGSCFIFNPGGYVGLNTFGEFFLASKELGMPIFALEPHYQKEVIFDGFVDFFVNTPEEFVEKQKLLGADQLIDITRT